jgi:hypothetical protein|tara:strand:- start:3767 stop:5833 length:2067 start_codon:yes stop_codon:yes gene_type:complete
MPLVNFTNLDFEQVKTSLIEYLRSNSNFTDYDFEGSNLSTIIDLLAYNTYITSYNANMVANEVFIDSATLRENVVSLARNIGYLPKSKTAATSSISFFVDTSNIQPSPASVTLNRGTVATSQGSFAGISGSFCILDDITVPVINDIATFDNISVYEGTFLTKNFTYNSQNPFQRFILPNAGVDTELMRVSVKSNESATASTKYSLQNSLFYVGSDSKVFYLQEVEDERYELIFGDGIFGKKLEENNYITIRYLTTNGDAGNGLSDFSFSGRLTYVRDGQEYTIASGISLLTTEVSSRGGSSIESVDSVKKYAPRIYASQNRAVTADDYETLIPARIYPDTESISVFGGEEVIPPQYGKVFISIKPKFGDFLPNLIKENIKLKLKKFAVSGIIPEILDLKYLFIETSSRVYYNTNLAPSSAQVSSVVQNNASKYANSSELNKYGARFKYSKFLKILDDSHDSITSNITTVRMRRDLRIAANSIAEYQIGFGNRMQVLSNDGYNIKTTAFKVAGIAGNVYLSDIPDRDGLTGSLFLFSLPNVGSRNPSIVKSNVGSIDYEKGIITINAINIADGLIKDGQPIIEIEATPTSNDVIGLQDLYLQLDNSKSTFEMVSDQIESGIDPSASNYIVSSSYATGNLVRVGGPQSDGFATTTTETVTSNSSFGGSTSTTSSGSSGASGASSSSGGGY